MKEVAQDVAIALGRREQDVKRRLMGWGFYIKESSYELDVMVESKYSSTRRDSTYIELHVNVTQRGVPVWFEFYSDADGWGGNLSNYAITQDEGLLKALFSEQTSHALLKLKSDCAMEQGHGHMTASGHEEQAAFMVKQAQLFLRAWQGICAEMPETIDDVYDKVAASTQDVAHMTVMYLRMITRLEKGDEQARLLVLEGLTSHATVSCLEALSQHSDLVESLLPEVTWSVDRCAEVLHVLAGTSNRPFEHLLQRKALLGHSVSDLNPTRAKRFPRSMATVLRAAWPPSKEAMPHLLGIFDEVLPWMNALDAAELLCDWTSDDPALCTYERMGLVLQKDMPSSTRERLVDAMILSCEADPTRPADPRWITRAVGLLQFSNASQVARIAPFVSARADATHRRALEHIATDDRFLEHPARPLAEKLTGALRARYAHEGSLSLSDGSSQEGELTSVEVQAGALSIKK